MTRRSPQNPEVIAGALKLLPARWAIAILVAAIAYVLLQPKLNQWFGWNLPSAAAMLGQETLPQKSNPSQKTNQPPISKPASSNSPSAGKSDNVASNKTSAPKLSNPERPPQKSSQSDGKDSTIAKSSSSAQPGSTAKNGSTANSSSNNDSTESEDLKLRFLKPVGRDRYESPAGLIYAPGSEEGHRLKHIERHLSDQPNRPGSHGVFDGDMQAFLAAIDDGYKRARGHAKGTKQREEEGMTVFEAPFDKPIGYLGGSEGARKGKPKLKRLRIVVRDKNLITAFPIQ